VVYVAADRSVVMRSPCAGAALGREILVPSLESRGSRGHLEQPSCWKISFTTEETLHVLSGVIENLRNASFSVLISVSQGLYPKVAALVSLLSPQIVGKSQR
jgi:hypothetical protein